MKRIWNAIVNNWYVWVIGCVLQRYAIAYAYQQRGYRAVGGEWLVLPVTLMAAYYIRIAVYIIAELIRKEDKDVKRTDCGRNAQYHSKVPTANRNCRRSG